MADLVFNIAKGRVGELYNRVKSNDPAASAFIIVPLETTGLESDAVLIDKDTLADVLSGTTNEQTNQARKVLTDADLAAFPSPDDTNDRFDFDLPDIVYTALGGNPISKLLVCYDDDTGAGTDANIIPLCAYDFAVTPDGSDVTAQVNAAGFYRAS